MKYICNKFREKKANMQDELFKLINFKCLLVKEIELKIRQREKFYFARSSTIICIKFSEIYMYIKLNVCLFVYFVCKSTVLLRS
jgi:hypothetical protein